MIFPSRVFHTEDYQILEVSEVYFVHNLCLSSVPMVPSNLSALEEVEFVDFI